MLEPWKKELKVREGRKVQKETEGTTGEGPEAAGPGAEGQAAHRTLPRSATLGTSAALGQRSPGRRLQLVVLGKVEIKNTEFYKQICVVSDFLSSSH